MIAKLNPSDWETVVENAGVFPGSAASPDLSETSCKEMARQRARPDATNFRFAMERTLAAQSDRSVQP